MPQTRQGCPNEEVGDLPHKIRAINRRHAAGEITDEERARLHTLLVPGSGGLGGEVKAERRRGAGRESERDS